MSNARLKLGMPWFKKIFMAVTHQDDSLCIYMVRNGGRKKTGVMCP
ncbi:MAG: hypothetical protein QGH62_03915 [Nitrospinaceae bacterium]|nr:hypothetical protein [Nitrospinaceae bacterium]